MALSLSKQHLISSNPAFKNRIKLAIVTRANHEWYSIQRAPQGTPGENIPIMTNMDKTIFNFSVQVMNFPDSYVERFSAASTQDTAIREGFNDSDFSSSDPANWTEIPDSILHSVVHALFVRMAGVSQFQIANNA